MNTSRLIDIEKKESNNCFTNCKIPNIKTYGRLMALNDKYLIMAWNDKPGFINIVNPNEPFDMAFKTNLFSKDNSNILDMEFSPFDSNIFYFSNENKKIYVTQITEQNVKLSGSYDYHSRKVYFIDSNPVASNLICSSTSNAEIHIWDSVELKTKFNFNDSNNININAIHWNPNGFLIGYSTKNGALTIRDLRNPGKIFENHTEINSKTKFVWLDQHSLATMDYKKPDKKFYLNLYDIRKEIKEPFSSINFSESNSSSSLTPFVDPELKINLYNIQR